MAWLSRKRDMERSVNEKLSSDLEIEIISAWLKEHCADAGCIWFSDTTHLFNVQTSDYAGIYFVEADTMLGAVAKWNKRFAERMK